MSPPGVCSYRDLPGPRRHAEPTRHVAAFDTRLGWEWGALAVALPLELQPPGGSFDGSWEWEEGEPRAAAGAGAEEEEEEEEEEAAPLIFLTPPRLHWLALAGCLVGGGQCASDADDPANAGCLLVAALRVLVAEGVPEGGGEGGSGGEAGCDGRAGEHYAVGEYAALLRARALDALGTVAREAGEYLVAFGLHRQAVASAADAVAAAAGGAPCAAVLAAVADAAGNAGAAAAAGGERALAIRCHRHAQRLRRACGDAQGLADSTLQTALLSRLDNLLQKKGAAAAAAVAGAETAAGAEAEVEVGVEVGARTEVVAGDGVGDGAVAMAVAMAGAGAGVEAVSIHIARAGGG